MKYHDVFYQIKRMLDEGDIWYEVFEHEAVRTSEEAAKVRTGYGLEQGAKALILRVNNKGARSFVMVVLPGNLKIDNKKIKKIVGASDIRFATEEEVKEVTRGVLPGGVPPFGNLFGMKVYADAKLFEYEKIVFNAGDRSVSVGMKSTDYRSLVTPQIAQVS